MDAEKIADLVKAAPEVLHDAYKDLAAPGLKQFGKFGEEIAKTLRLVLFPIQFAAALQDKVERYVDKAIRQVPQSRLITPTESILGPVAEKLRFQEQENPITDLYVNLLSRAMDGERVGEAHPAFVGVISQLAPDEVLFMDELSTREYTLVVRVDAGWATPTRQQLQEMFVSFNMSQALVSKSETIMFGYNRLNDPRMFYLFLEHLYHLGLVEYVNEPINEGEYRGVRTGGNYPRIVFIRLSHFGALFHKACISGSAGGAEVASDIIGASSPTLG